MLKKWIAILLIASLILTGLPAAAEDSFSGTWYLISMGLTAGTFDLNEDGSCALIVADAESGEKRAEGTWSAEGDVVTLNVEDQALTLTYDGTNLILGAEALGAFGGETGGLDPSILSAFIMISREPGVVTSAEYAAYQADGTLPEGKTQEEMEGVETEITMLAMTLFSSLGGLSVEQPEPADVTLVEENFYIRESWFGQQGLYIAKVRNDTDAAISLDSGLLTLQDADGNEISRMEYLGTCGSRYLEPGESTFVSMAADIEEGLTAAAWQAKIEAIANSFYSTDINLAVDGIELREKESYGDKIYTAAVTVTNPGEDPLPAISMVAVLRNDQGEMIDIVEADMGWNELAPGSAVILCSQMNSDTVKYAEAQGSASFTVEACAWAEIRDY